MSQVGREGAHKGERYLGRLKEGEERRLEDVTWTEGRPPAPQCGRRQSQAQYWFADPGPALSPPATCSARGKEISVGSEDDRHLLFMQTDHLTSRAKQGATLEEEVGR